MWLSTTQEHTDQRVSNIEQQFESLRQWIAERDEGQRKYFEQSFLEVKDLSLRVLHTLGNSGVPGGPGGGGLPGPVQQTPSTSTVHDEARFELDSQGAIKQDEANEIPEMPKRLSLASSSTSVTLASESWTKFERRGQSRRSQVIVQAMQSTQNQQMRQVSWRHHQLNNVVNIMQSSDRVLARFMPQGLPQDCVARFVRGDVFATVVAIVVISSSAVIGMEVNKLMRKAVESTAGGPSGFETINLCFTIFFIIELALRAVGWRVLFLLGEDKGWNLFDSFLVAVSLIDLFFGNRSGNLAFMRVLRALRMARVLRVVRLFRFFRELRRMVMSILAAVQALAWAFLLLLLVMYVFAIVLMRAGADFLNESGTDADRKVFDEFYGTITVSMYMLLQAISGGQDWNAMAQPLEQVSGVYVALYVFFILFIVFGVLNVLTGVFLSAASEVMDVDFITQAELLKEKRFVKDMMTLFQILDADGSQELSWEEFCVLTTKPEIQSFFSANGLNTNDGHLLFSLCAGSMGIEHSDHDAKLSLTKEDFVTGCVQLKGPANQLQTQAILIELEAMKELMTSCFPTKHETQSAKKQQTLTERRSAILLRQQVSGEEVKIEKAIGALEQHGPKLLII